MNMLEAIEKLLDRENRPLNAKEIVAKLQDSSDVTLGGSTPWKTVGARLAEDIRTNPKSRFIRIGRGLYALKIWPDAQPFDVKPRRVNPLDEDIRVIERGEFLRMIGPSSDSGLYGTHYSRIVERSFVMNRRVAEDTQEVVQLIPSFLIFRGKEVLSFHRTRKSPEQRLHDRYSIVFGGHLQAEDDPGLFREEREHADAFLFRELHEELSFSVAPLRIEYVGVLHLQGNDFERQHAGLVFAVDVANQTRAKSMEPGYHSALQFLKWAEIAESPVMSDRWSEACINHIGLEN